MSNKRVILSGGGTGGHIFPAISIARKLEQLLPGVEILFVGANGKMEMEKVPQAGYKIKGLPVSAFHRRLTLKNLTFPFKLIASLLKANKILREFKPDLVIGTGGFASGPILNAASRKGIPCLLQEQNAFPGITNRMLSKKVKTICVAHEGLEDYFPAEKIIITGNPVREDIVNISGTREEALKFFGLKGDKPIIFVFGGSLGARTINHSIENKLEDIVVSEASLIWQTGKDYFTHAKELVADKNATDLKVYDFIYRMDLAYKIADIIISRAGAISISELCLVGKPAVLVPYPHAAGDHQLKNARSLVEKNAGRMVEDHKAVNDLVPLITELLQDKKELEIISKNINELGKPDATEQIVAEALKLISE